MHQTLFRISFDAAIPTPWGSLPVFGFGLLLVLLGIVTLWSVIPHIRRHGFDGMAIERIATVAVTAFVIFQIPNWVESIPVYGFGAMLLLGFLGAGWLGGIRAKREGFSPELTWDAGMWVFIPGILGARVFSIAENWDKHTEGKSFPETIVSLFNFPEGGLVLYGGVISAGIFYFIYCSRKKISALYLADMIIPCIFVGEMFGRIGCLLNGCCFGDATALPWGVCFPRESFPYNTQVMNGELLAQAPYSLPLHPTQIYSSLNALVLALLTWNYFPFRRKDGEVLLVGWTLYPITRFCLEILRDEPGRFGTVLTTSQWVSLGMLVAALLFRAYLNRKTEQYHPLLSGSAL